MYCPKCDMEFVEGITVCTDCGSMLVDREAWEAQQKAEAEEKAAREEKEKEEQAQAAMEAYEKLSDEDKEEIKARTKALREMMEEPAVYINEKDKYTDNRSSAVALLAVGILLATASVMMWFGIIPDLGLIMKLALTVFAVICLAGAVISNNKAKQYKKNIANEEESQNELIESFLAAHKKEEVESAVAGQGLREEELDLERMNYIQDKLTTENDIADKAYAAMIAEEIFSRMYE